MNTPHFDDHCASLATEAIAAYSKQMSPVLYLFGFRREDGAFDKLTISTDRPQHFTIVICTHIPRNHDKFGLTRWFVKNLRNEPVLPAFEVTQ